MTWAAILAAAAVITQGAPAPTPAVAPQAPGPAESTELSLADQLRQLREIYNQSCGDRAYGSFEDACHDMSKHIRDVQKAARKEQQQQAQGHR